MSLFRMVDFVALFFAGTLSGIEIATHYGFSECVDGLSERAQLQLRQALVRRLRVMVPSFFFPTFVLTGISAFANYQEPMFALRLIAVLGYLVWIYARVVATVKINSATLEWNIDSPPVSWLDLVRRAERFHIASAWSTTVSFASLILVCAISSHG